jgi:hypothetical protein
MNGFSKSKLFLIALALAGFLASACAHGPYRSYHRWGGWYYDPWLAPVVVGATVGTAVYLSQPVVPSTVVVTSPPVVVAPSPVEPSASVPAYYCRESGQYFPTVQTCVSPWLVVTPR